MWHACDIVVARIFVAAVAFLRGNRLSDTTVDGIIVASGNCADLLSALGVRLLGPEVLQGHPPHSPQFQC